MISINSRSIIKMIAAVATTIVIIKKSCALGHEAN